MKSLIVLVVLFSSIAQLENGSLHAQESNLQDTVPNQRTRKWMISFIAAARISGIGKKMESSLVEEGFGDTYVNSYTILGIPFHTSVDYPRKSGSSIPWDIEIRYKLNSHGSIAAGIGNYYHGSIEGYNKIANGGSHYLTLETNVWIGSMDYIFTLPDAYSGFRIGPVLAKHQIRENGTTDHEQVKTSIKPGINVGFDASLFEKKSWFMALSFGYTWIAPVSVGPYAKEVQLITNNGVKPHESIYEASKISLSSLKIGFTMGWRI